MSKFLLTLAYHGAGFCGFQVQKQQRSIQSTMQDAIEQIYGERLPVVGCSRTDAGVHARDYKLTFVTDQSHPCIQLQRIPMALNAALPSDIAVLDAEEVPLDFHVRHDVYEKEYEYLIHDGPIRSPFYTDTVYHYKHRLDAEKLNAAAQAFLGTHDFRGFMAAGSDIGDTVRTVHSVRVFRSDDGLIHIRISANGFLYNMVRIIVGTLLAVAEGRIDSDSLSSVIDSGDRTRAGITVPAHGLYLNRVEFLRKEK